MRTPPLSANEAALWARVMANVRPIAGRAKPPVQGSKDSPTPVRPEPVEGPLRSRGSFSAESGASTSLARTDKGSAKASKIPVVRQNTLDGSWDRDFAKGVVSPDRTIDLHGHTLQSAHDLLDSALDHSIRAGDRVILLVTGKPPRPTSERPHARGAIRAAVGDWLARSRHASAIAAVRPAHPRHGGAGALYIVLRRARFTGSAAAKF